MGEIDLGDGYKTHASYFLNKMEWELYVMNKLGALLDSDYYKISSYGIGRDWDWEDDLEWSRS